MCKNFLKPAKKGDRNNIKLHACLSGYYVAKFCQNPRDLLWTFERCNVFRAALSERPVVISAHQVKGVAGSRNIEDSLLNGTGEIKKIGVLHEQYTFQRLFIHQGL